MSARYLLSVIGACVVLSAHAQQFAGLSLNNYSAVQQMPYNPAWVCNADRGTELHLFSVSGLVGTNAYTLSKGWLTRAVTGQNQGEPTEDKDYAKDQLNGYKKYLWGNVDALGPAVSLRLRPNIFVGAYIRARQVVNGGNFTKEALQFIGDQQHIVMSEPASLSKAGFTLHAFTELGVTYGAILKDDGYHRWYAGATLKYLSGIAVASVYAGNVDLQVDHADTSAHVTGDLSVKYSTSMRKFTDGGGDNNLSSWLNGGQKHSFGLDLGVRYEYHPAYNPNHETPYLFSIAASITDIGRIRYMADTGSALYEMDLTSNTVSQQQNKPAGQAGPSTGNGGGGIVLPVDSLLQKKGGPGSFRVGLPTAFRLNADLQLGSGFAVAADVLLNLQSTKRGIYNPGYANTYCFTPRFERKGFMIGVPFCFVHHQQMTAGAVMRAGPVFIGSSSLISCAITNHVNVLDGYAGVCLKFKPHNRQTY